MKTLFQKIFLLLALFAGVPTQLSAQGTAFTYQGRLNDTGGAANGSYDLKFTIYDTNQPAGNLIAGPLTNSAMVVSNGLFLVSLDFGAGIFTGPARWLEIAVRTNGAGGFSALTPRQPLTPAPYAIFANTASNVTGTVPAVQLTGTVPNSVLSGFQGAFNSVGGGSGNNASSGYDTIGGGQNNAANNTYGTVGGGFNNIAGYQATVPGGSFNVASGFYSFAAGQRAKALHQGAFVWADSQTADFSSTANDQFLIRAQGGVGIGTNGTTGNALTVAGNVTATSFTGDGANVTSVNAATLNGFNATNFWQLGGNNVSAGQFVGSTNSQPLVFIVNGQEGMRLEPTTNTPNVVGGYAGNYVQPGLMGVTIGGGGTATANQPNRVIANAQYALIAGGYNNTVASYGGVVVGGSVNFVGGVWDEIVGGQFQTNVGTYSFIGGGYNNNIQTYANYATIGGGFHNSIQGDQSSAVIGLIYGATIAGGLDNFISTNADGATIGGGSRNMIQSYSYSSVISGGFSNIVGGLTATLGGGSQNQATNNYATVPGGFANIAGGSGSFAAGQQAQAMHQGAFVWADSQNASFPSTANDQFLIRAQGGVGVGTNAPAASLDIASSGGIGFPQLRLDQQQANDYSRLRFQPSSLAYWDIAVGANAMNFYVSGVGNAMSLATNGNLTVAGTVTAHGVLLTSDRNAKENFTPLDGLAVLAKVAALPVTQWNYKSDSKTEQHIGPMAQDFQAAFQLSADDKHISVVDEGGVALAAIQGLNQKLDAKDAEIADLKARLEKIEQLLTSKTGETK